jgi:hypothetical protein
MQPFPLEYEPSNLTPCFILRSRREVNTVDSVNSRFVNYWQNDYPQTQTQSVSKSGLYMDMNPTCSRLYREDLNQNPPYQPPSPSSAQVQEMNEMNEDISKALNGMQTARNDTELKKQTELYNLLLAKKRDMETDSLGSNPYFAKYNVAADSRNIVRELRGAVSEAIVDRGIKESQQLLKRSMENRWVQQKDGLDSMSAFELLRPKFNNMSKTYN